MKLFDLCMISGKGGGGGLNNMDEKKKSDGGNCKMKTRDIIEFPSFMFFLLRSMSDKGVTNDEEIDQVVFI